MLKRMELPAKSSQSTLTNAPALPSQHYLSYLVLAFIAMSGLSYINFLPGVVNALAGGIGFSDAEAGQIVALNGYGGLLGSGIAIVLVRRVRWQPVLFTGLAVLALLDFATAWLVDLYWLLSWRFCAGAVGGLAFGMVVAQLARLDNPNRAFGCLLFVQFSIGSLVMVLLPALEAMFGAHAVFLLMAALCLLSLLLMLGLPAQPDTGHGSPAAVVKPKQGHNYRHVTLLLLAIAAYQMAASAIWAYVGLIGLDAGISHDHVSSYIAGTGLLGLLGAALPMCSARRAGRLRWLLTGSVLSIIAAALLNFSEQHTFYLLAMALLFVAWPAVQSYLLAVTAELDRSGRLSTIATLVASVGLATGPLLASMLLLQNDFSTMLYSCAALFGLSVLLLYKPVQAQEQPSLQQDRQQVDLPQPLTCNRQSSTCNRQSATMQGQ